MAIICSEHKLLFIMVPGTGCSVVGEALKRELGGIWLPESDIIVDGKVIVPRKHNTIDQILVHNLLTAEERDQYLVFATVRNPFDRFVTYYQRLEGDWTRQYLEWSERHLERRVDTMTSGQYDAMKVVQDRHAIKLMRRQKIIRILGFNLWLKSMLARWKIQDMLSIDGQKQRSAKRLSRIYPMISGVDVVMRYEQLEEAFNEVLYQVGVRKYITLPRKNITPNKRPFHDYYSRGSINLFEHLYGEELEVLGYRFGNETFERAVIKMEDLVYPIV